MYLTHKEYSSKKIKYAFFTKKVESVDHRYFSHHENYKKNRELIAKMFLSENILFTDQKHTKDVILVESYKQDPIIADGQITTTKGLAIAVATADCVPLLLADEDAGIVSCVHAGWRGAKSNIMQEAVDKMHKLGANNITAIIGPCIRQESYEVSQDFYDEFLIQDQKNDQFFLHSINKNHYMFNLPAYVKAQLKLPYVKAILDMEYNTYQDEENFFSFRKTTHNPQIPMGNIVSAIMLL